MGRPEESALMQFAFAPRPDFWKAFQEHALIFVAAIGFVLIDNLQRSLAGTSAPPLSTMAGFCFACTLRYSWKAFPALIAAILVSFLFSWGTPLGPLRRISILIAISATYPLLYSTWQKREITFLRVRDILYPFVFCASLVSVIASLLMLLVAEHWQLVTPPDVPQFLILNFPSMLAGISIFAPATYLMMQDRSHLSTLPRSFLENVLTYTSLAMAIIVAGLIDTNRRLEMEVLSAAPFPFLAVIALRHGLRPVSIATAVSALGILGLRLWVGPGMWERSLVNDGTYYGLIYLICVVCLILGTQRDTIANNEIQARLAHSAADFCPWDWTFKGGLIFRSPAWTRKVGLAAEEPLPMENWIATVHPDEHQSFAEAINTGSRSEHGSFNMRFRSKDVHTGEWFWSKSIGLILKHDADGKPLQAVGVVVDIHDAIENEDARIELIQHKAELSELRTQLNPHFLFNCLNSIRALVGKDAASAREMITMLSGLLRYLLRTGNRTFDSLEAEIGVVMKYLNLEKVRFGDRLNVSVNIDPASLRCNIPGMLVLTLVENAVKHGISKLEEGGIIRIETQLTRSALAIRVFNSGRLTPLEKGMGLENTRRRVELLAGSLASFDIREVKEGQVCAILILPRESLNLAPSYEAVAS